MFDWCIDSVVSSMIRQVFSWKLCPTLHCTGPTVVPFLFKFCNLISIDCFFRKYIYIHIFWNLVDLWNLTENGLDFGPGVDWCQKVEFEVFTGSFSSSIEQVFQMINFTRTRTQQRSGRSMSLGGEQAFLHRTLSLSHFLFLFFFFK